ncbi:hypothetical protein LX36DRAFT_627084 [Colletotrichum falcatum]|nr:hypothetical protein LX36DRAFT_627084 [Colletotrichum falcatum]
MPTSARRQQPPQTGSPDDAPPGNRRSKRLGNVEIEEIRNYEALRTRKRRRTREDRGGGGVIQGNGDDQGEGEDNQGEGEDNRGEGEDNRGEGEDDRGEGEDNQGEGEHAAASTTTAVPTAPKATNRPDRRQARRSLRVDTLRKAANTTQNINSRNSKVAKAPQAPSRESGSARLASSQREARPPGVVGQSDSDRDAESDPVGDAYEFRDSPPRRPESREATSTRSRSRRVYSPQDFQTGNGLFVQQEADNADENNGDESVADEDDGDENEGDVQLFDDPTIVGIPPSAQIEGHSTDDAVHGAEPQPSAATEQLQRLVADMGPAPPESSDEADGEYPDDVFIFNKPTREDRVVTEPVKSHSLKSVVELMCGTGWTKSRENIAVVTDREQLSRWTRPLWNELCHLKEFWEGMPRAPLFNQQFDYLHSDEQDATSARQTIKKVDSLVSAVADKAKRPSRGEESDMPPPRFVVDLFERTIPFLVSMLETVFQKGAETERSSYTGRFTKMLVQIMQRVVAWIERLYEAMQASLARRRLMEQSLSKSSSRVKLGEYLRDFKHELERIWEKTDEIIERHKRYEAELLKFKAREERAYRELEEARRQQRELCDRRLHEHVRRSAGQTTESEAPSSQHRRLVSFSQPQYSQRTSRGTRRAAPARLEPGDRAEAATVGPSKPWPKEDVEKLLRILTRRTPMDKEGLVWEFSHEHSEEDIQAMVELLKQTARARAASRGKTVPAFASN